MQQELLDLIWKNYQPIFKAYDKDGNSTLQKPQLRLLLADNLGVTPEQITQDQLDWHFNQIDDNGDGHITFNQYFNHLFLKSLKTKKVKSENQDQLIDKEEFRKLLIDTFKSLNIEVTNEMVDWNFDKIDTDHSGRISFDEYLKFIKKYN